MKGKLFIPVDCYSENGARSKDKVRGARTLNISPASVRIIRQFD